ncbi:hypothetical protein JTE90_020575 [Oedothorax gibbosus]|uniref:Uncharacterized protein n=1 Tax=Oedothorax gibbosus TaxID=931172 RepID=A0AAV6VZF3_9ARAC|nr:hypothetical protein JTE90_020575 [Oedothorax gibbosus]
MKQPNKPKFKFRIDTLISHIKTRSQASHPYVQRAPPTPKQTCRLSCGLVITGDIMAAATRQIAKGPSLSSRSPSRITNESPCVFELPQ